MAVTAYGHVQFSCFFRPWVPDDGFVRADILDGDGAVEFGVFQCDGGYNRADEVLCFGGDSKVLRDVWQVGAAGDMAAFEAGYAAQFDIADIRHVQVGVEGLLEFEGLLRLIGGGEADGESVGEGDHQFAGRFVGPGWVGAVEHECEGCGALLRRVGVVEEIPCLRTAQAVAGSAADGGVGIEPRPADGDTTAQGFAVAEGGGEVLRRGLPEGVRLAVRDKGHDLRTIEADGGGGGIRFQGNEFHTLLFSRYCALPARILGGEGAHEGVAFQSARDGAFVGDFEEAQALFLGEVRASEDNLAVEDIPFRACFVGDFFVGDDGGDVGEGPAFLGGVHAESHVRAGAEGGF